MPKKKKEQETATEALAGKLKNPFGDSVIGKALSGLFGRAKKKKVEPKKKKAPKRIVPKPNPEQQAEIDKANKKKK